ncbi:MAG: hypothetical protein RSD55_02005 [Lachnospiraceae bacterium]
MQIESLQKAKNAVIEAAKKGEMEVADLICIHKDQLEQAYTVTIVFATIDDFLKMQDLNYKDTLIEAFLKELIREEFSFGNSPDWEFLFDMNIS